MNKPIRVDVFVVSAVTVELPPGVDENSASVGLLRSLSKAGFAAMIESGAYDIEHEPADDEEDDR